MARLIDNMLVGEPATQPLEVSGLCARVLVLGVGNLLMGDEGVGVHVLRQLE